ncbi:MAG: outer membrane protein assembly factor BamE [Porticoccaceae bacterium]|nr:MAG: outer membrane protein assembly factor BamE [Porticoccaceae bacterium]
MPHPRALVLVLAVALLTGCASSTEKPATTEKPAETEKSGFRILPRVFKFPIQQGNVVTQEMVDKLQPGMTRSQVRFIMGTPLIVDTFNQNRWDYLYTLKLPSGKELREQMTILFDGDRLVGISGDYMPGGGAPAQTAQPAPETAQPNPETAKPKPEAAKTESEAAKAPSDNVIEVHGIGD